MTDTYDYEPTEEEIEDSMYGGDCLTAICPKCGSRYDHPDCECGYSYGQDEDNAFTIAECVGGVKSTVLQPWTTDFNSLVKRLSTPIIGNKDGAYCLRCNGTTRSTAGTEDIASIAILDGDSRIDENGEIKSGAPAPADVSEVLSDLNITHCIYSSYSNGANREEITAKAAEDGKSLDEYSGGAHGANFHKYRVIIPCRYSPEQLPVLLDYLFSMLHKKGVMLAPVSENRTWAQAWYFPRVPDSLRLALFDFHQHKGDELDTAGLYDQWLKWQESEQPQRPELPPFKPSSPINESGGRRNPIKEFNQTYSVHDVLLRNGYTRRGDRYLRPGSTSKIAAVQICQACGDGIERVYSHGGDVLNDEHSHDAFDCYRLLECGGAW